LRITIGTDEQSGELVAALKEILAWFFATNICLSKFIS
jgi:hypothetical protein